jgi:hypothetical protein
MRGDWLDEARKYDDVDREAQRKAELKMEKRSGRPLTLSEALKMFAAVDDARDNRPKRD